MERRNSESPPPQEIFTIAEEKLNIRHHLDGIPSIYSRHDYNVGKMKPGDDKAIMLIRALYNLGVTSKEYFSTMPRLLEYAAKKECGFDADFIDVTRFLMDYTQVRMEEQKNIGDGGVYYSEDKRLVYFSNVYGKLEMVKALIWHDPKMAEKKKELITKAQRYLGINPDY